MIPRRKVVVATASYGAGHSEIAEAVSEALRSRERPASVVVTDLLERCALRASQLAKVAYRAGEDFFPSGTGDLHAIARVCPEDPLVLDLSTGGVASARAVMDTLAPDAVLAVHPVAAAIAAEARGDAGFVIAGIVPSLGEEARLWLHPGCDLWFTPTPEVREELVRRGVGFPKAVVSGVPVREEGGPERGAFGLEERFTAAVPEGVRDGARLAAALASRGIQVITPDDAAAAKGASGSVRVVPAETPLRELAAVSHVVVTGPSRSAQWIAPALGTPMIVVRPVPAMEAPSVRVLCYAGAALVARDAEEAADQAAYLMRHPARVRGMERDAAALGRPSAARAVVERLLAETA